MSVRVSVETSTVSIQVMVNGFPFTIEIEHPLVGVLLHIAKGSFQGVELHPLYIVENDTDLGALRDFLLQEKEELAPPPPKLLVDVQEGLGFHEPEFCEEGVNGSYFMKNKNGQTVAIFKPADEEGRLSPKRKKSSEDDDEETPIVDRGIADGEGAQREVAAYLLDRKHFSSVPETITATFESFKVAGVEMGPKTGSLQEFVENDGSAEDIGPGVFPAHQVHKIGVLDMRIFNNDRHLGNILYRQMEEGDPGYQLVPIDHGLSLSPTLEHGWFDWLMWPQAKHPFDEKTKEHIASLDVEEDARVLRELGIREECIQTMKITTTFLKKATTAGLTLYDIGTLSTRTVPEEPSELENMVEEARAKTSEEKKQSTFFPILFSIMDKRISGLSTVSL